jgi:L-phenylalanine/L-methionine N-acetyltransferase
MTDYVIRSAEPSDAEQISALLGVPGVFEGLLQMPFAPTATRMAFHEKMDPSECRLVAVAGGRIVGACSLHVSGFTLRRSHARMVGIFVAPEWQGKGIGRKLLSTCIDWADNWAHVLRIELQVHADNPRAKALYESLGFVQEGHHKSYALKGGKYVDSYSMARLHPNPPRIG